MNTTSGVQVVGNVVVRSTRWTFDAKSMRAFPERMIAAMIREAEENANRAALAARAEVRA